jgi:signal transduction histidine kinase
MQAYIKAAESTALRLKRLSDDMFGYLLVFGNSNSQPVLEEYNADTLIGQMLSEHILLIGESGYNVDTVSIDEGVLVGKTVLTDPQSLIRIFDNAFSNLYKYADKKKPIKISISAEACNVIVEISNYIRRDGERVESNGIGLRTCKKLAEQIGAGFEFGGDESTYSVKLTLPCK